MTAPNKEADAERAGALRAHALAVTETMLRDINDLADVWFKCNDGVRVPANKFVLATQAGKHFAFLYRHGDSVNNNSLCGKVYELAMDSQTASALFEYLYTGRINRLEVASQGSAVDANLTLVTKLAEECFRAARSEAGDMAGLKRYLADQLRMQESMTLQSAFRRLSTAQLIDQDDPKDADMFVNSVLDRVGKLPFDAEAFEGIHEDLLAIVLARVQFDVSELEICRAVARWAHSVTWSSESDDEGNVSGAASRVSVPKRIVDLIDFTLVSPEDLVNVVEPLQVFPAKKIVDAYKSHVFEGTTKLASRVSMHRGNTDRVNT